MIATRKSSPSEPDDELLAVLQQEATERVLRNWDRDELDGLDDPPGGTGLARPWVTVICDAADDFAQKRLTPWIDYSEHLRSDRWRTIRRLKLARCGGICERCHRSWRDYGFLDVHHLDYRRFGAEREAYLIVLCRECHLAEHQAVS